MALEQVRRHADDDPGFETPISSGLAWLAAHQNEDGGWGDTVLSFSNISTTMLAHAVFHATGRAEQYQSVVERAHAAIERAGGVPAVIARYGKDKTFSVPILTHCALAGLVEWRDIPALPFELACVPAEFYAAIRLPVVSYALPALIAIGQVRHHFQRPKNRLLGALRDRCLSRSLRILEKIQPANGGFLEATPLTSFVTMSLAAKGEIHHPVVQRGIAFIRSSMLDDGSWPIDTNLATWVTTLSVNALKEALPPPERERVLQWLIGQQYVERHPYTNAAPGGWAWTDLPGGVPDADDTPGALLALLQLSENAVTEEVRDAIRRGVIWLLDLQNRDGGWPTFCRGWGALPFDRSACDLTAHAIRALHGCRKELGASLQRRVRSAITKGFRFLQRNQSAEGYWLPLWFGNQHAPDDINPVYGTCRVLAAYRDVEGSLCSAAAKAGAQFLKAAQNEDGGWGGVRTAPSSIEETALAVETLAGDAVGAPAARRGIQWLLERVEAGTIGRVSPIGFYFAKLWYFEELYPLIFATAALRSAAKNNPEQPVQ
jgi:squalene-hopene/tetraprenyl-beta-curcumene cyclase